MIVGPGPGDPRDGDDPKIAALPRRRRRAAREPSSRSSRSAWATRCCATGSASPSPTRTSSSRAPSRRSSSTAGRRGSASTTRSSARRSARRRRCRTGVERRRRPGDRRRPPGHRPALPRHPVPRRVDPHRARLRPDPRPGPRPAARDRVRRRDVVVVDHHDSYTWNLVHLVAAVTGVLPDVVAARRGPTPTSSRALATSCSRPAPGTPTTRADFAVGRAVLLDAERAGARACAWACRASCRRTAARSAGSSRARRGGAGDATTGSGVFAGLPSAVRGGALPLAGGARRARRAGRDGVVPRAPDGPTS